MLVRKQDNISSQPASLPFPIISAQAMGLGVERESPPALHLLVLSLFRFN